jgi:streptogramin lyase
LAQLIKPGHGLDAPTALDIAMQVAEGLQFAHRRGIIHRDLKPANILLGTAGQTCLADFGLARTMFNDTIIDVERDQMEGTAPYMSPGVAAGNAEDTRCDIYAFGALLYEMLTGEPPYAGRSTQDIRKQILSGPPRPIRAHNPEADLGLAAIAEGAMARELRNRYADMTDVLADLERVKQGKTPVGPHGLVSRVRHTPAAVWVISVMAIAIGLFWIRQSSVVEKKANVIPSIPNPAPTPVVIKPDPQPEIKPSTPVISAPRATPPIIVGDVGIAGTNDGIGSQARFSSPSAVAVDAAGYLYVADMGNNTIRKVSPSGDVTTLAGLAGQSGQLNGQGAQARFIAPSGIAVDEAGNVYVAEFASDTIRKISPEGAVSLLAGSPGNAGWKDAKGDNAHFRNPWSVAVDKSGHVYVADKDNFVIREITPDGTVSTIAGKPGTPGFADGKREMARFRDPQGVAVDYFGNVYVADTGNQAIRKISPSGEVTTIAQGLSNPESVAVDAVGTVYFTDNSGVHKIANDKVEILPALMLAAEPDGPAAHADSIAVDKRGKVYVDDTVKDIICWPPK